MALLLGAVAWGLIVFAAAGHIWHQNRLMQLLAVYTDHERPAAVALVIIEVLVAVAVPASLFVSDIALAATAIVLALLGIAFTAWIARLLATGSDRPCACSFSTGPTSPWSLLRSLLLIGGLGLLTTSEVSGAEIIATLAVGLAIASAIFVLPESLTWPEASRAQLARMQSHSPLERDPRSA